MKKGVTSGSKLVLFETDEEQLGRSVNSPASRNHALSLTHPARPNPFAKTPRAASPFNGSRQ